MAAHEFGLLAARQPGEAAARLALADSLAAVRAARPQVPHGLGAEWSSASRRAFDARLDELDACLGAAAEAIDRAIERLDAVVASGVDCGDAAPGGRAAVARGRAEAAEAFSPQRRFGPTGMPLLEGVE